MQKKKRDHEEESTHIQGQHHAELVGQRTDVYMLHACIAMLGVAIECAMRETELGESQAGGIDSVRVGVKRN